MILYHLIKMSVRSTFTFLKFYFGDLHEISESPQHVEKFKDFVLC